MNQSPNSVRALSCSDHVHARCDAFENDWKAGQRPDLEPFLEGLLGSESDILLTELLYLELYYRRKLGETPNREEYLLRFAGRESLLEKAWNRVDRDSANTSTARAHAANDGSRTEPADHATLLHPDSVKLADHGLRETLPSGQQSLETAPPGTKRFLKKIGRYEILEEVGAGSFGVVYRAHDPQLDCAVAVKVARAARAVPDRDFQLFRDEARRLAKLNDPRIVRVFDVSRTDEGLPYVVTQFYSGPNLGRWLKANHPSPQETARIVADVAEALHHAHQQDLVHRDVKPDNILMNEGNRPVLADFGLALLGKEVGQGPKLAGTVLYMSPEQAGGASHLVDARSDIFSLGVVLFEMLTGKLPSRATSVDSLLEEIIHADPRPAPSQRS